MNLSNRDVVILMFKYSVVVKGIERKLQDMDCHVHTVSEDLVKTTKSCAGKMALFLFYLPNDICEDPAKKEIMDEINEITMKRYQNMILIGEDKYRDDLYRDFPALNRYTWLERPLDMKVLERTVEDEIKRANEMANRKRILIVDDDPAYAKMIREMIKDRYRIDIVNDGMQAISFLAKISDDDPVNLILLDYEMPVIDGPKVLEMLRQDCETALIPVVFLTGLGTREALARVLSLKPDGYLLKSTPRTELVEFLHQKLG